MIHWYVLYLENWDDIPSIRNELPWITNNSYSVWYSKWSAKVVKVVLANQDVFIIVRDPTESGPFPTN